MFDILRKKLALMLYPEYEKYDDLLDEVQYFRNQIGPHIPELKQSLDWILGATGFEDTFTYKKFTSMVNFRDILINEYKRKQRGKNEV